jgi:hypothetical protein
VEAPTINHPATTDHRPAGEAIPAPTVRPYQDRGANMDSDGRTRQASKEAHSSRDQQRAARGIGGHYQGCTAIVRGCLQFEDAVIECQDDGSQSGPSCSPASRGQRLEVSRLPGLFRVGSNSYERMDCSTVVGNTTETRPLSRGTVEDTVRIQPPEMNHLGPNPTTGQEGSDNRARRPTNMYTTLGSSFCAPRPSSHR